MLIQVVASTTTGYGTFQHAEVVARAFARLGREVLLTELCPPPGTTEGRSIEQHGVTYIETSPSGLQHADLTVIVGLCDVGTLDAAQRLSRHEGRIILAPTTYWPRDLRPNLSRRADALWYVSWDQASWARDYWHLADRVSVLRCAVDVDRFSPPDRVPHEPPWVIGRHSRDAPAKFSPDMYEYVARLSKTHEFAFRMLGAARTAPSMSTNDRVVALEEDAVDPRSFLRDCDLWVFDHSPRWRETACVAMLEAMATGLPVVVTGLGGMREYVQHGRTGFLANSLEEFLVSTVALLDHPDLYLAVSSQARSFVEHFHSIDTAAGNVWVLTKELLG